jgi:hypothetical protein
MQTVDKPTTAPTEISSPPGNDYDRLGGRQNSEDRDRLTDIENIAKQEEDVRAQTAKDRN